MTAPTPAAGEPIELRGYPMHMVHAEKIATAVQRAPRTPAGGDFGDVWSLSRQQPVNADDLA